MSERQNFIVSFRAQHPTMPAEMLAEAVGFEPNVAWTAGDPRETPKGRPLDGVRSETYIAARLPAGAGDLTEALAPFLDHLTGRASELSTLVAGGAELDFYVTLDGPPGVVIAPELMKRLANLNIALGLDGIEGGVR